MLRILFNQLSTPGPCIYILLLFLCIHFQPSWNYLQCELIDTKATLNHSLLICLIVLLNAVQNGFWSAALSQSWYGLLARSDHI
jgi:hypothetical protein